MDYGSNYWSLLGDDGNIYIPEYYIAQKNNFYLIKWKYWNENETTWEPREHVKHLLESLPYKPRLY